jgi:hypothetical protein
MKISLGCFITHRCQIHKNSGVSIQNSVVSSKHVNVMLGAGFWLLYSYTYNKYIVNLF